MTQTDFDSLVQDIQVAFDSSAIKRYAEEHRHNWLWDRPTHITRRSTLSLGFNPGAEKNVDYAQYQAKPYPEGFLGACERNDAGSLSRIRPYLKKYFPKSYNEETGQANYCFFRSENEGQISNEDVQRCQKIFLRLLSMAEPSEILCFSSRARDFLVQQFDIELAKSPPISFQRGQTTVEYHSAKGDLLLGSMKVPTYFLPHPSYKISNNIREQAWTFCFGAK